MTFKGWRERDKKIFFCSPPFIEHHKVLDKHRAQCSLLTPASFAEGILQEQPG